MREEGGNVLFIYNPSAGSGEINAYLDDIVELYQKHGYSVTLHRINKEVGYENLPPVLSRIELDHILIAGGDGTVNRLVNFLKKHDFDIPIAVMPAGTANDFATLLGVPTNPLDAVRAIINGTKRRVDMAKVGDRYFVNVLSCGLMCDISHRTPTFLKNTMGKVAYFFSGITELPNFRKIDITITSEELTFRGKCLLVMVFNGKSAGSFKVARKSSITDGVLDVFVFKGTNIGHTISMLFHFLLNRKGEYPSDLVYFQTNKLRIDINGEDVTTDVDGEIGDGFPMEVEALPSALSVVIPKGSPVE